jgi:hypothetical protein
VGIVSTRAFRQPCHKIESLRSIQAQWIAIEQIRDDGIVSICRELISHQLAVLPDTDHIGKVNDRGILVYGLSLWLGNVGLDAANLGEGSCGFASVVRRQEGDVD